MHLDGICPNTTVVLGCARRVHQTVGGNRPQVSVTTRAFVRPMCEKVGYIAPLCAPTRVRRVALLLARQALLDGCVHEHRNRGAVPRGDTPATHAGPVTPHRALSPVHNGPGRRWPGIGLPPRFGEAAQPAPTSGAAPSLRADGRVVPSVRASHTAPSAPIRRRKSCCGQYNIVIGWSALWRPRVVRQARTIAGRVAQVNRGRHRERAVENRRGCPPARRSWSSTPRPTANAVQRAVPGVIQPGGAEDARGTRACAVVTPRRPSRREASCAPAGRPGSRHLLAAVPTPGGCDIGQRHHPRPISRAPTPHRGSPCACRRCTAGACAARRISSG